MSALFTSIATNQQANEPFTEFEQLWIRDLHYYLKSGVSNDTISRLEQLIANATQIQNDQLKTIITDLQAAKDTKFQNLKPLLDKVSSLAREHLSPILAPNRRNETPSDLYRMTPDPLARSYSEPASESILGRGSV